ncbi:MAG: carotenoid 1,2-hydratase [Gammaproteobacteria bacterium]|nr:carotenoid 1,2-hydratase [Gammaproteobacteria bacterium]
MGLLLTGCSPEPVQTDVVPVSGLLGGDAAEGFQRAYKPRTFEFPRDHGVHPGYRSEWWYITGNLYTEEGRRFGFQVTFFRFQLAPSTDEHRKSRWATDHLWMAHTAISDPSAGQHYAEERLARGALGLAGASAEPFRIWLEDWRLEGTEGGFPWQLMLDGKELGLQLQFNPVRAPMLQGKEGLSQKGAASGNASYYYSIPRMETRGMLSVDEHHYRVSGLSWLDREWGTSALGKDQVGWDWFSLQLNEGVDLMYYQLRMDSGESAPQSAGTMMHADGAVSVLGPSDLNLAPERWWTSPSGARYPISWKLTVRPLNQTFLVTAVMDDQEMDLSVTYWEGAVDVFAEGRPAGRGYLEMTGY